MIVHKKCQLIRSSRLAGDRQHIDMNVLFYYIDKTKYVIIEIFFINCLVNKNEMKIYIIQVPSQQSRKNPNQPKQDIDEEEEEEKIRYSLID